jgi:hypothetical protein
VSDEQLRVLERAAAADPAQALAHARALERAGRADEGWLALCRALEEPAVRAELATRPAWSHRDGPGHTRALDVPPVRRAPRVRWEAPVRSSAPRLLASALGVVTMGPTASGEHGGHELLDPRTGLERARGPAEPRWLDGELLVGWLLGRVTPAPYLFVQPLVPLGRGAVAPESHPQPHLQEPALFRLDLAPRAGGLLREGQSFAVPPELHGPSPLGPSLCGGGGRALVWSAPGPMPAGGHAPRIAATFAGDRLLLSRRDTPSGLVLALDDDLTPRWRHDGQLSAADADGALLVDGQQRLVLLDTEGRLRWSADDLRPLALGRDVVVALVTDDGQPVGERPPELVLLDRATGARRTGLGVLEDDWSAPPIALVRDVVLLARGGALVARALDGSLLWRVDLARETRLPNARVTDLAPLPGAIAVGLSAGPSLAGRVVCLEEAP